MIPDEPDDNKTSLFDGVHHISFKDSKVSYAMLESVAATAKSIEFIGCTFVDDPSIMVKLLARMEELEALTFVKHVMLDKVLGSLYLAEKGLPKLTSVTIGNAAHHAVKCYVSTSNLLNLKHVPKLECLVARMLRFKPAEEINVTVDGALELAINLKSLKYLKMPFPNVKEFVVGDPLSYAGYIQPIVTANAIRVLGPNLPNLEIFNIRTKWSRQEAKQQAIRQFNL